MTQRRAFLQIILSAIVPASMSCSSSSGSNFAATSAAGSGGAGGASGEAAGGGSGASGSAPTICDQTGKNIVAVGLPSDHASLGLNQVAGTMVLIGRDGDGRYFARSAICAFLDCNLNQPAMTLPGGDFMIGGQPQPDGGIECLCCGSVYSSDGSVAQGPTKKPLEALALEACDDGQLWVDTKTEVDPSVRLSVG